MDEQLIGVREFIADNEESNSTNINDQDDETTDNPSTSMLDNYLMYTVHYNVLCSTQYTVCTLYTLYSTMKTKKGKVYASVWRWRTVIYLNLKLNGL